MKHNKIKNENANEVGTDVAKSAAPVLKALLRMRKVILVFIALVATLWLYSFEILGMTHRLGIISYKTMVAFKVFTKEDSLNHLVSVLDATSRRVHCTFCRSVPRA